MTDQQFHIIGLLIQSGLFVAFIGAIWYASSLVTEFRGVKDDFNDHVTKDEANFKSLSDDTGEIKEDVALIRGHLGINGSKNRHA